MLATPWCRLCLAAFGLNLVVVAVLRDSRVVVAVLRGSVGTIATCTVCLKKTSPTFAAVTLESIIGFS